MWLDPSRIPVIYHNPHYNIGEPRFRLTLLFVNNSEFLVPSSVSRCPWILFHRVHTDFMPWVFQASQMYVLFGSSSVLVPRISIAIIYVN